MNYRFSLDKSSPTKLFKCPLCHHKALKRYWDNELNEYLNDSVGRCNREVNCGYHLTPKQYFEDNEIAYKSFDFINKIPQIKPEPTYIDWRILEQTLNRSAPNHFANYLRNLFQDEMTETLVKRFKIATSTHWEGATIFWQIDEQMRVHTGKIMLYNAQTGKRVKEPFNHIHWVHSLAKWKDFNLERCFFGLHQVVDDLDKTIGIVESEKTAILLTAVYPKITWLASGGMGLTIQNFEPLKNRKIILYPDVGNDNNGQGTPFQKWQDKAEILELMAYDVSVSNLIEQNATQEQRIKGYDLADYLIKTDPSGLAMAEGGYPTFWDFKTTIKDE